MEVNRINRRNLVIASSMSLALVHPRGLLLAQEATPHGDHAASPSREASEITVNIDDTDIMFPAEIQAGINHVTFENGSSGDAHILTFSIPEDLDMDAFFASLFDEEAPFPEELRDQYFPGIADYPPVGGSATAFVNYEPGNYLAINIFGTQNPGMFTVVGNAWGVPPPRADHEVGMVEMEFVGLEEPVASGEQIWSLVNFGHTWHEILMVSMPELVTPDELMEFFLTTENPDDLEAGGYGLVAASGIMSPGAQIWMELDLAPGAYGAMCMAPDNFSGPPHALVGMVSTFEVA